MNVFTQQDHTLILGDALEVLREFVPDKSVDLLFCDPPYNIGKNFNGRKDKWESDEIYLDWCYEWMKLCFSKMKDTASFYLMAATQNMPYLDIFMRKHLTIMSRIIWYYDSSGVQAKNFYGSLYEPILHCVKNPKNYVFNSSDILVEARTGATRKLIDYRKPIPTQYNTTKVPGNVWSLPRVRYRMAEYENHPTQKPEALLERIVLASSNPGDMILDPFAGTFTTCFVAQRHKRRSIGIEIEEEYLKIGLRRLGIATEYNGENLHKPLKTYEAAYSAQGSDMPLFED